MNERVSGFDNGEKAMWLSSSFFLFFFLTSTSSSSSFSLSRLIEIYGYIKIKKQFKTNDLSFLCFFLCFFVSFFVSLFLSLFLCFFLCFFVSFFLSFFLFLFLSSFEDWSDLAGQWIILS